MHLIQLIENHFLTASGFGLGTVDRREWSAEHGRKALCCGPSSWVEGLRSKQINRIKSQFMLGLELDFDFDEV